MSLSNKLNSILSLSNKSRKELTVKLDTTVSGLNNKFSRNVFTVSDLIKIADFCDCQLSFTFKDGSKIVLDISDLKE